MTNNAYVYLHRRIDNGEVFYVGIGTTKNFERAYTKASRNRFWNRVIKKTDHVVDIIYKNLFLDDAKNKEINLIAMFGKRSENKGNLVNISNGGEGCFGVFPNKHTRNKMSISAKGRLISDKTKLKISTSLSKKLIINNETGEIFLNSKEVSIKYDIPKGTLYKWLEGHRINNSVFSYYFYEHKKDLKVNKKIQRKCKKVYQYTKNFLFIKEWDSIKNAERSFGSNSCNITSCISGRKKSAFGFIWSSVLLN